MGPLVPDIIGNELNLVVALLIGIAFGFILEQAGFSSSRKLVGLFYGYDFTVLRVFFTAGITAMFGVIALGHFGMLDLNLIYINPTYIWPAILGGLIMGLGFVIGGFCPGTSVCAAATGKTDAMYFIGGIFIGVFLFAESYGWIEEFYKSGFWGYPHIFETLGMSQAMFAVLLTLMAVAAFAFTAKIQKKTTGQLDKIHSPVKFYYAIGLAVIIISLTSFLLPERQSQILEMSANEEILSSFSPDEMSVDEFAFRLLDDDRTLFIVDLRSKAIYDSISFPNSYNMSLEDMFGKQSAKIFSRMNAQFVIAGEDETSEKKAAYIADRLGFENVVILSGGIKEFNEKILNFEKPETSASRQEADTHRFREKASIQIPELLEKSRKKSSPEKKESKRVLGGC